MNQGAVAVTQNLRNCTKALYGFDAVIQRVPPDAWGADSPCEGWCVRDVVAHACGVMNAVEAMARSLLHICTTGAARVRKRDRVDKAAHFRAGERAHRCRSRAVWGTHTAC
jgi:uncharacterized protein (TIGR03083 family)